MHKRTMTYTDYNGVSRTEDFYFNLTKAELLELEMSINGGVSEMIRQIIATKDSAAIVKIFKDLILKAYGKKSLDGKRFEKSEEIRNEFSQTEAYSDLFMLLSMNADEAAKFFNAIIPSDNELSKDLNTELKVL